MDVFDLYAKIKLDTKEYENSLKDAGGKFSSFGEGLKSAVGKMGDILAGVGKAAAAGTAAAGAAFTALAKQGLDAYADFEQLQGGVNKIFGESAQKLMDFANNAYKTAGLSANQYMETVTSFSASLLQSLDGDAEAAADTANRAIIDMSDNINTYGGNMESVMNAYQGFAKQNYTMLDNLKLGYGGTQAEMKRLIEDAAGMNEEMAALGVTVDADSMSFGNIINAISVMQQRMKIAGTTSKEASSTISGSVGSLKAAWQNFLAGTGSTNALTEAFSAAAKNIGEQAKVIIPNLASGLGDIIEQLSPEIPSIIETALPAVIDGTTNLVAGIIPQIPKMITTIASTISSKSGDILEAGKKLFNNLIPDTSKLTDMSSKVSGIVGDIAIAITNPDNIGKIVAKGDEIVGGLINGILSEASIDRFVDDLPVLIDNIGQGIEKILLGDDQDGDGGLFGAAKQIIVNLGDYFADDKNKQSMLEAAGKIISSLAKGVINILQNGVAPLLVEAARTWAECFIGDIDYDDTAKDILSRLAQAMARNMWTSQVGDWIGNQIFDATHGMELDYLDEGSGTLPEYKANRRTASNDAAYNVVRPAIPFNADELRGAARNAYNAAKGYASGGYADRLTRLNNAVVGENGAEVLLPLESNTAWMDKLIDRFGSKIGAGNTFVVESVNVYAPSGDASEIARATVNAMDEAFSDLQIAQDRSIGGVTW